MSRQYYLEQVVDKKLTRKSIIPNSIHYNGDTKCGIEAFGRPCQLQENAQIFGGSCPQNSICEVDGETVYIVDDDHELLHELRELVEWCGFTVKCFSSAFEFQQVAINSFCGCVVLDVVLPASDGTEIHTWLKHVAPDVPVVFLSGASNIEIAVDCMRTGAVEFLVKPVKQNDLRRALNSAMGLSRMLRCRRDSVNEIATKLKTLTPTEWRVAQSLAQGLVTKQIASVLGRSENTVKIHRARIFKKLNIISSASLLKFIEMKKYDLKNDI